MDFIKFIVKALLPKLILRAVVKRRRETRGRKNERNYQGNDVVCPCCGKSFSRFMDCKFTEKFNSERFAGTYRNTVCPYCFSLPRHRIICYYFDNNKGTLPNENIIMFGAEESIEKWFSRNSRRYTTADLFDRTADIKADIQNMPFIGGGWKLITCNHVLEHVPDYKKSLAELKRILSGDGILELTVPTDRSFERVYEDAGKTSKE